MWRVRIGAGVYAQEPERRQQQAPLDEYVLQRMSPHDHKLVKDQIDKLLPNLVQWLEHGQLSEETVHL
jgi:peptidyl-tRNA hydrolase